MLNTLRHGAVVCVCGVYDVCGCVWCGVCVVCLVCVCVYGVCVWCKLNCVAAKEPRHTAHTAMQHISSCTSPYSSLRTSVCLSDRNAVRK